MRQASALASAFLSVFLLAAPAWAQQQDCALHQAASLPLTDVGGRLSVTATLDGVETPLMLDLNDSFNTLYPDFVSAHKFNLERARFGRVAVVKSSNLQELNLADVQKFVLGPVTGSKVEFLVLPADGPTDTAGALSQTGLAAYDFELDMRDMKLNLFLQDHCPGKVVYWTNSGAAQLPFLSTDMDGRFAMQLDGKPVRVLLDPSSGETTINSKAFHRLFGLDLDSPGVERVAGTPDDNPRYRYHFGALAIDAITIRNPNMLITRRDAAECDDKPSQGINSRLVTQQNGPCFGGWDVVLGAPVLRQLRLFFANKEHMLYLTPASVH